MTDEKTETPPKIDHMHFGHIHISNQNKNDESKIQIINKQVSLFTNIILTSKVCLTLYCQIIYENWCQTTQGLRIRHFFFLKVHLFDNLAMIK
jgi:hypothetical protein